jgi:hypothetical protein
MTAARGDDLDEDRSQATEGATVPVGGRGAGRVAARGVRRDEPDVRIILEVALSVLREQLATQTQQIDNSAAQLDVERDGLGIEQDFQ